MYSKIESLFKEEKFRGAPDQCIEVPLRDFHICANNQSLTNQERSKLIVNCLNGGALEFHFKKIDPQRPYQSAFDKPRVRYNTPYWKISLRSEIDSLTFDDFMARKKDTRWERWSKMHSRISQQYTQKVIRRIPQLIKQDNTPSQYSTRQEVGNHSIEECLYWK